MEISITQQIFIWDEKILQEKTKRVYKTTKNFRDPRIEKIRDFRKGNTGYGYHYNKESKYIRNLTNRLLRRKLNRNLYAEYYYRVTSHDYKTSGWLTW